MNLNLNLNSWARQESTPPDIKIYKNENNTKAVLISSAPDIENVFVSGGGLSAPMMFDAIGQLEDTFQNIGGVSAGALVGILLASGLNTEEASDAFTTTHLPSMLGSVSDFNELYPDIQFKEEKLYPGFWNLVLYFLRMLICKIFLKIWQVPAEAVVQVLDKLTSESVSRHLKAEWPKLETAFCKGIITEEEKERLFFLKDAKWFDTLNEKKTSRTKYMITFGDLEILHRVLPSTFKKLHITSAIKDVEKNGTNFVFEKKVFDAEKTPDASISIVGRTTISIPFCFKDPVYKNITYADGGMASRLPVEMFLPHFPREKTPDNKNHPSNENYDLDHEISDNQAETYAKTAVFVFRNKKSTKDTDIILHQPPISASLWTSFINILIGLFLNDEKFSKKASEGDDKLYNAGVNVYVVDNEDIDLFDIHTSKEKYVAVKRQAHTFMQKQLEGRKGEAYALSFSSVEKALQYYNKNNKSANAKPFVFSEKMIISST